MESPINVKNEWDHEISFSEKEKMLIALRDL